MGYSQSWLAVRGKPRASVLDALGLEGTGKREEIAESPIVGADLPGGWFLVVMDRACHRFLDEQNLRRVSAGCDIVTGDVEEHVMVSAATGWDDGHKVWSVTHNAQRGTEHLDSQGELPPAYVRIRDRLRSEQQAAGGPNAEVDHIFDVPVELAQSLTGYRYDLDISGAGDKPFEVLIPTSANPSTNGRRRSFWKRLLG
jgi:hypothetical protein